MADLPSYLIRDESPHSKSRRQEKKGAKKYGGYTTVGSGNKADKGDVNAGEYKIEFKRTDKKSISVPLEWLTKIKEQAFAARMQPALEIEIKDESWTMIPSEDFKNLIGK